MERKIEFSIDEFYHSYSRGVDKRKIYLDNKDSDRFLALLYLCNSDKSIHIKDQFPTGLPPFSELLEFNRGDRLVAIGAYCLMPNHFHILMKEIAEGGISKFMGKLLTGFSMYFNKRHVRTGRLFESTFRAEHADEDKYLEYLFAYIHLNSVKLIEPKWREEGVANIVAAKHFLKNYKYSSHQDYLGGSRPESAILDRNAFPEYFETSKEFKHYLEDVLNFSNSPEDYPRGGWK